MSDRIHPAAIDATGYVGDGAQYLADDGTWKAPAGGGGGGVSSVVAGAGIAVDSTDPANPIVSATGGGGGGGTPPSYSVVDAQAIVNTATHSITPVGATAGDLAIWAVSTRNANPAAAGPEGAGWTKLWEVDTGTTEMAECWYKIVGASETYPWTWNAGTTQTASAVAIYRGVDTLWIADVNNKDKRTPALASKSAGLAIIISHDCDASDTEGYPATAVGATTDVTATSSDFEGSAIYHAELTLDGVAVPSFIVNNKSGDYRAAGVAIFY